MNSSNKDSENNSPKRYTIKKSVVGEAQRRVFKIDYERDLNPDQLEVVKTVDSPVLVIAGAGTGKTKTLIYRVAYLVELGGNPQSILLLTFTRKSCRRDVEARRFPVEINFGGAGIGRDFPLICQQYVKALCEGAWIQ